MRQTIETLVNWVAKTDSGFRPHYHPTFVTHPILFFGQIETARVLTVGANPSYKEFALARNWPSKILHADLENRCRKYFDLPTTEPHTWFAKWETALSEIGCSYENGTAAHIDLSPRATKAMRDITPKDFIKMLQHDIWSFQEILKFAEKAELLLIAGAITPRYYINEFLQMSLQGECRLENSFRRDPGSGKTAFHTLVTGRRIPVFFCSVSPSARNSGFLIKRIHEHRDKLKSILQNERSP